MIVADKINVIRNNDYILKDISFLLSDNCSMIITGESGSGKTTLAKVLSKQIFAAGSLKIDLHNSNKIVFVEQRMIIKNKSNTVDGYYQQRYNSFDNQDADTVLEALIKLNNDKFLCKAMLRKFNIEYLSEKSLLMLSSGEHKKFQLVKALLSNAGLLILDEPYIGLDAESRKALSITLDNLAKNNTQLILIQSAHFDYPSCFTHVLELCKGKTKYFGEIKNFSFAKKRIISDFNLSFLPSEDRHEVFSIAVKMTNVNIRYGDKTILKNIHWQVNKGERWLLSGVNGSGKSTLLSLITADNPQAYANEIYLFDKKRGTGESIWDIKKKIGFMSSELHAFFDKTISCYNTIASGFFDTMGYIKKLSKAQMDTVSRWIEIIGLKGKEDQSLHTFSTGNQRQMLIARALVKNPPLLIFDEPCQGLDKIQTANIIELVDRIAKEDKEKTIIYVSHYKEDVPECINKEFMLTD